METIENIHKRRVYICGTAKIDKEHINNKEEIEKATEIAILDLAKYLKDFVEVKIFQDTPSNLTDLNYLLRAEIQLITTPEKKPY